MKVCVLKYNAGNVLSVMHGLKRCGIENPLHTDDEQELRSADKVIFPGVGEASSAMRYLRERGLDKILLDLRAPLLGICLGLQLLCASSEENATECLGVFPVAVRKFTGQFKVPHMGWNSLETTDGALFKGVSKGAHVYFVHSFYAPCNDYTVARTDYAHSFSAGMVKDNFYALQFHPEKSGPVGELILKNFLDL